MKAGIDLSHPLISPRRPHCLENKQKYGVRVECEKWVQTWQEKEKQLWLSWVQRGAPKQETGCWM